MDLKELGQVDPTSHWYYQAKLVPLRWAVHRWVPTARHFLDVGAGSGFFSISLAEAAAATTVVCVDTNYEVDSTDAAGRVVRQRAATPEQVQQADVALFIDVLEHVDDDLGLLRAYTDRLPTGALVLLTVPAFQSLWSAHDEFLQHVRRYRLSDLDGLATRAGLEVVHRRYLFGSVFPLAWVIRRLRRNAAASSDLRPLPSGVNAVLRSVLSAEHQLRYNRVAGLTAFVAARVR